MSLAPALLAGLATLKLEVTAAKQQQLLNFIDLLEKWNRIYNLTALREPEQMLAQHILDSLAVVPHLQVKTLADVGSGAGLPGIPLAVALDEVEITLIDSNHKKATFMREAQMQLNLKNVQVICARAEAFQPVNAFDAVISRAFSDLAEFVRVSRHLCAPGGRLFAMKGLLPYEEILHLPADVKVVSQLPLKIPGVAAQRHLIILEPS